MPRLRVLDRQGDAVLEWTRGNTIEQEEVDREFRRLVEEGRLAYRVDTPGKGTLLREFDPDAEEIVFHNPLVGG